MSVSDEKAPFRPPIPAPGEPAPGPPPVVSPIVSPITEPIGSFPPSCPPPFGYMPGYPYGELPECPGVFYPWREAMPPYGGAYGGMYGGMPCYGMPPYGMPGYGTYGGMPCVPGGDMTAPVMCPRCGYTFGPGIAPWYERYR